MKHAAVLLLALLVACKASNNSGDDYPEGPGGGGNVQSQGPSGGGTGTGSGSAVDAGIDSGDIIDSGVPISGRVCLINDLRFAGDLVHGDVSNCDNTAVAGNIVTLGSRSATTDVDGTFHILAPEGGGFVWHVFTQTPVPAGVKTPLTTSVMPFGTQFVIPVMAQDVYQAFQGQNGAPVTVGQGGVVVQVLKNGAAVKMATATSSPVTTRLALYDGDSPVQWNEAASQGTGERGLVWFPDVPTGNGSSVTAAVSMTIPTTVLPAGVINPVVQTAPVEDGALTFVTKEIE